MPDVPDRETDVITKEMLDKAWESLGVAYDPPWCPGMIERARRICTGEDDES